MTYVDGFVVPVPKDSVEAYTRVAKAAGEVWMELGALSYVECQADDVPYGRLTSFPRAVQAEDDEVVFFAWITYESRQDRDEINAKIMSDDRIKGMMDSIPVDMSRMIYGGFKTVVRL